MPNVRIHNTVANARIGYNGPNVRVSNFQTGRTGDAPTPAGSPIGLLLALTYATTQPLLYSYGDFRPNVRITST